MKLLLPYAYDIDGNLVHIDDAIKGVRYTCPSCGAELSLKISQIPPGQRSGFTFLSNGHCSSHLQMLCVSLYPSTF